MHNYILHNGFYWLPYFNSKKLSEGMAALNLALFMC